jgi:dihydroorotase-like cyclic amidohydrolase
MAARILESRVMANKRALLLLLLTLACTTQTAPPPASAPAAESTRRYTVLMAGNKAGVQTVQTAGDQVTVDFEFTDRGRGPKTRTVMHLGENGQPARITTTGNDYLKQQIEERFSVESGVARWKNTAENGESALGGLYASMYGPPEELAVIARTLLRNGGRMKLLPAGEASIRKVGEMDLRGTRVTAYEISGFGFTPYEVWLDDQQNFFGSVSSWFSTIREGFEADVPAMIAAQDARKRERGRELMAKLVRKPAKLVVKNASVFDPRTGNVTPNQTIVVEGKRIVSVGSSAPSDGEAIDAAGRFVMPGMWDMHTHSEETDALLNIAAGITSVRDLGNDPDDIMALKNKVERGEAIGPRFILAGLVDGRGPFQGPTKLLVSNEEEARKAIDFLAENNFEGLKIYSSIDPLLVPFMTNYAHSKGLRVSGHIPAGMRAENAVDAGYDEIQHANMLFLNFMPDVKETRTPARFTEVANRGADLDLNSAEVRAFIEKLRARGVVIDPTLTAFESMITARAGTISPSYASIADRLPPQVRRTFLTGGLPIPEGKDDRYNASFRRMLDLVAAMHDAGVKVVAGTDALSGFAYHRELELYAQAGIPTKDVLRIATLQAAQIMKRDDVLGTIEAGKLADFIIVDGDPLARIADIRKVKTVIKDGEVYDVEDLYDVLGVN